MFIFNHISFKPSEERKSIYPLSNSGDKEAIAIVTEM